jgi:hypothetical protein
VSLPTRTGNPAPNQLAIEPLRHCLIDLGSIGSDLIGLGSTGSDSAWLVVIGSLVISSIQRLLQHLLSFRKLIMMLVKWRGTEVRELFKGFVHSRMASVRRAGRRARILKLLVIRVGHVLLPLGLAFGRRRLFACRFATSRLRCR